jgi:hypothetical protein
METEEQEEKATETEQVAKANEQVAKEKEQEETASKIKQLLADTIEFTQKTA